MLLSIAILIISVQSRWRKHWESHWEKIESYLPPTGKFLASTCKWQVASFTEPIRQKKKWSNPLPFSAIHLKLVKFYKIQLELLWSAIELNNWINVVCQLNSKFNSCTSTWTLKIFKIPRNFSKTFSEFFRVGARDRYRQILHYCENEIITWPILSFFWWINKKNHLCACLR